MDLVAIEVARGCALRHGIAQGLDSHHRIDDLWHRFCRVCQRHGGHLEQQARLPGHPFEIGQEFLVDALFCLDAHLVHVLEEQLDEAISEVPHPAITEQGDQRITPRGWMTAKVGQRCPHHAQVHPSEIPGGKRGQQGPGELESLEMAQRVHRSEEAIEAPRARVSFQGAHRGVRRRVGEQGVELCLINVLC
jgi:hypothetical protein